MNYFISLSEYSAIKTVDMYENLSNERFWYNSYIFKIALYKTRRYGKIRFGFSVVGPVENKFTRANASMFQIVFDSNL